MSDTTPSDDFPHWMTHDNSWMKYPCVANRYRRAAKHLRSNEMICNLQTYTYL